MPSPDYKPPEAAPEAARETMAALRRMLQPNQHDLTAQIMALREEIAALRRDLAPVPSLIVTGREALDEFKRLKGRA